MLVRKREAALARGSDEPDERGGSRAVTVAALTLIAIQLIWMTALLTHSYFRQDDFPFQDGALAHGFTWSNLMLVRGGHLLPLAIAIAWVTARVALYSWPLASLTILVLLAAACLALLRMLRTLFGDRPAILIPLLVYVFSPLALATDAWWAVALELLPLQLATFMAVDAHVRYLRSGRYRSAVAAAGWLLLGMAATVKGAVVPLLLFALTSAFFVAGRWGPAAIQAAKRHWRVWALYGVLLAGYGVLFAVRLRGSSSQPGSPGASHVASLATTLVGTTLVPGVLGGPWRWFGAGYAAASPPAALQQLSWAIAALVIVVSCWSRVRAWRAWAVFGGWVLAADVAPVAIGRLGAFPAALLGLQTRYVCDAAAVLALCLGLAFLPLRGEQGDYRFRLTAAPGSATEGAAKGARYAIGLVLAAYLAGSFWSLQTLGSGFHMQAAQSYIATAQAAVAQAPHGTVVVDGPTPAFIMDPQFFLRQGYTSQVIGPIARAAPPRLSWTRSPRGVVPGLMIFNAQGQLQPAAVTGPESGPPPALAPGKKGGKRPGQKSGPAAGQAASPHCWPVTTAGTAIPVHGSLYRWDWFVRLDYSGPAAAAAVSYGGAWADVALPAGAHSFYVPVVGAGSAVTVRLAAPAPGWCLNSVTVGSLQPAPAGPAIPSVPLAG